MKKILWSTAAAALFILSLSGCANTATPVQTENRPPKATVEGVPKPTEVAEGTQTVLSAGNALFAGDSAGEAEASAEPIASPEPDALALATIPAPQVAAPEETLANVSATPAPQETPAPAKVVIKFDVTTQKGTEESPSPKPSATPEPEPTLTPALPAESVPPVESMSPAFSIDRWLAYAQSYARNAGLNLDPTATGCWDNPIVAGAHCTYLERDLQSRLNRYARDDSITDVWIWAQLRSDGSYDLYIGYA